MEIKSLGHSSFLLKGKKASLVTDPFDSDYVGFKFPRHIETNIVTISHDHNDHNCYQQLDGNPFVIREPGEYDIGGIEVIGVSSNHDSAQGAQRGQNTMFRINVDNIVIGHLGDLGQVPTTVQLEELDGIDILMIPVGGVYTIGPKEAKEVISEIEPSIVIPMHYHKPGISQQNFENLAKLDAFISEMGKTMPTPVAKLLITKDKLPEETEIIVFE